MATALGFDSRQGPNLFGRTEPAALSDRTVLDDGDLQLKNGASCPTGTTSASLP